MEILLGLLIILAYHLAFVGIGYGLGKRAARHEAARMQPPSSTSSSAETMLREIDSEAFASMVGTDIRQRLRDHYEGQVPVLRRTAPPVAPTPAAKTTPEPVVFKPEIPPVARLTGHTFGPTAPRRKTDAPRPKPATPRPPVPREPIHLDPALVLLYLGAFLIVAAGLIYASFNWEELEGGQKMALLGAATAGFLVAGTALLGNTRLRPAAETFIGIGALLIPSNIIAAMTLLSDTPLRATIALQLGAALATLLYAFYAHRPGGPVYRHATVVSAAIAIGVLPASLGAHRAWALPMIALAPTIILAILDRLGRRSRRFLRPTFTVAVLAGMFAMLATAGTGMPDGQEEMVYAAILAGWSVSLGTVAAVRRFPEAGYAALTAILSALAIVLAWSHNEAVSIAMATGLGLLLTALALRGPRAYRTTLVEGVSAAALIAFAVNALAPEYARLAYPEDAYLPSLSWLGVLSWWLVPAGWTLVAVVRRWWPVLTAVAIVLMAAYGATLDRLGLLPDDWATAFRLAPAVVAIVAVAASLHTRARPHDRSSPSFWLWIGAGMLAAPIATAAVAVAAEDEPLSRFLAVGLLALLTAFAVLAAQQYHSVPVLLVASLATIVAISLAIEPIPVGEEYRSPVGATALGTVALALPLGAGRSWWRRRRTLMAPQAAIGAAAIVASVPMLGRSIEFITGALGSGASDWWPWYAATLLGVTLVSGWTSRAQHPRTLTAISATSGIVALGLALRAAADAIDPDPLAWPPVGIALGLLIAAGAVWLHEMRTTATRRWAAWTAVLAALVLIPAAGAAVARTAAYILSDVTDVTAFHVDEPVWWVPMLLAFAALGGTSHAIGIRHDLAALSVVTLAGADLSIALALRMLTTDLFAWSVAGMVFGGVGLAAALALRRVSPEQRYLFLLGRIIRLMPLAGVAGLAANITGGIDGEIDPWRNVALYAALSIGAAVASVRLRLPEGLYASTSALGLAVLFVLLTPQIDALDGLAIPAAIAWMLVVSSLAPGLDRRWAVPLEYSGYAFGTAPVVYARLRTELEWDIDSTVYQRVTLAIVSLGLVLGLAALAHRCPRRASVAIPLVTAAVLRQVATYEPESWQPYAVVLAVALVATGLVWHRTHRVSDPLYALAGAVLILAPFMESFTIGDTTDAFIAGGYGILVVVLGLVLRRQEPVAVGVVGVTLVVMRQLVDTAMAFESWQVLGTAGAILLIGGTVILMIRDTLRHWVESGLQHWHSLG